MRAYIYVGGDVNAANITERQGSRIVEKDPTGRITREEAAAEAADEQTGEKTEEEQA